MLNKHTAYLAVFHIDIVWLLDPGLDPVSGQVIHDGLGCQVTDSLLLRSREGREAALPAVVAQDDGEGEVLPGGCVPFVVTLTATGCLPSGGYH